MKKLILLIFILIQVVSLKATDCEIYPFDINYQDNIDNQESYFIQGVKLETVYHGIKLKVINNFKSNTIADTIMIWCSDGNSPRIEYSNNFVDGDTLICLITITDREGNDPGDNNDIPDDLEKDTDYMPISCNYSILKNVNDSVIGRISNVAKDTIFSYDDFFSYLTTSLNITPNFERKYVSVFPNPSDNYLTFDIKNADVKGFAIQILNINGQLIDSFILPTNEQYYQYDANRLTKGIYMINFYTKGNLVSNQKFIKQ